MVASMIALVSAAMMPSLSVREVRPDGVEIPCTLESVPPSVGTHLTLRNYNTARGSTNRIIEETIVAVVGRDVTSERVDTIYPRMVKSPPETMHSFLDDRQYSANLKPGEQWEDLPQENGGSKISMIVLGSEKITTPAGEFCANKIAAKFKVKGRQYTQVTWFSPAISHFIRLEYIFSGKIFEVTELISVSNS